MRVFKKRGEHKHTPVNMSYQRKQMKPNTYIFKATMMASYIYKRKYALDTGSLYSCAYTNNN